MRAMMETDDFAGAPAVPRGAGILTHPIFPLVAGMWCAAFFGIGSLLIPAEFVMTPLGMIDGAQAPYSNGLETGVRLVFCAFATFAGFLAGLLGVLQFAKSERRRVERRGIAGPSIDPDDGGSWTKLDHAPLRIDTLPGLPEGVEDAPTLEPLDLGQYEQDEPAPEVATPVEQANDGTGTPVFSMTAMLDRFSAALQAPTTASPNRQGIDWASEPPARPRLVAKTRDTEMALREALDQLQRMTAA